MTFLERSSRVSALLMRSTCCRSKEAIAPALKGSWLRTHRGFSETSFSSKEGVRSIRIRIGPCVAGRNGEWFVGVERGYLHEERFRRIPPSHDKLRGPS